MRKPYGRHGFSLVEVLLVTIIIGIALAVVVPRAWRANTDSKYNLVRQTATELATATTAWAENQFKNQGTATLNQYFDSLDGLYTGAGGANNWNNQGGQTPLPVSGVTPTTNVETTLPVNHLPVNPFNGASYFVGSNGGTFLTPGALYCAKQADGAYDYYAFLYLGTDSEGTSGPDDFHGGQASNNLQGLKNGVLLARIRR
jgi:prepilin-type N-terminal cleavage/methylation domain-containing protein